MRDFILLVQKLLVLLNHELAQLQHVFDQFTPFQVMYFRFFHYCQDLNRVHFTSLAKVGELPFYFYQWRNVKVLADQMTSRFVYMHFQSAIYVKVRVEREFY